MEVLHKSLSLTVKFISSKNMDQPIKETSKINCPMGLEKFIFEMGLFMEGSSEMDKPTEKESISSKQEFYTSGNSGTQFLKGKEL